MTGAVVHLFNHALIRVRCSSPRRLVFRCGTVRLNDLGGIGRAMPLTFAAFVAAGLSLIGIRTAGFVSKYYLIVGAMRRGGRLPS